MLVWLSVWSEVQTCIWLSWCHCHSLSLAAVKSRLVLPFRYRLTWVVPDKGPLSGCMYDVCFFYFWRRPVNFLECINEKPHHHHYTLVAVFRRTWVDWFLLSFLPHLFQKSTFVDKRHRFLLDECLSHHRNNCHNTERKSKAVMPTIKIIQWTSSFLDQKGCHTLDAVSLMPLPSIKQQQHKGPAIQQTVSARIAVCEIAKWQIK